MIILHSPVDGERLTVAIADVDVVQLDEPLQHEEYRALAGLLEKNPHVTLRAYGFDPVVTSLEFLRFFPRLRRFSVDYLHELATTEPLNSLPSDLEHLDLGETKKPLDLRALKFERLRSLRVVKHTRGLAELVAHNPEIRKLALNQLKPDKILSHIDLRHLEQLEMIGGSVEETAFLQRFPKLRYVIMSRVKGLDSTTLEGIRDVPQLEWLWLNNIASVTTVPDLSRNKQLVRLDLDNMNGLRDRDALSGAAAAPNLHELSIIESKLPVAAIELFRSHKSLSAITVGLGNAKRNQEASKVLDLPPARSALSHALSIAQALE